VNKYLLVIVTLILTACQPAAETPTESAGEAAAAATEAPVVVANKDRLSSVLAVQAEDVQARYRYRNPQETLDFFGVEPGMTVVEALPGRGWYTKILLPYLGAEGHLIGVSYAMDLWPNFRFATEEFLATQASWTSDWPAEAEEWRGESGASIAAYNFGAMPDAIAGTADVVLIVRALHNAARFASQRAFLDEILTDAFNVLKPGCTLGIVQHHARDDMSDEFADGSHGYLKTAFVIAAAEAAGFEFVAESDINANPLDQPTAEDVVWRLPPSYATSQDDPELKAKMDEIGESNRMTLKFRKPE
jgi:predicted methyltransferase